MHFVRFRLFRRTCPGKSSGGLRRSLKRTHDASEYVAVGLPGKCWCLRVSSFGKGELVDPFSRNSFMYESVTLPYYRIGSEWCSKGTGWDIEL
jgi:hypothetical protein